MFGVNVKMAIANLRSNRWRSLLTMLGIIIGVSSVIVTVSLGEGLKHQVSDQITQLGNNVLTVRPGKLINRDKKGNITGVNPLAVLSTSTLSDQDVDAVKKLPFVTNAVPISFITNSAANEDHQLTNIYVLSTGNDAPNVLNQKIAYGAYFDDSDNNQFNAIIGPNIAAQMFNELNPVGRSLNIDGQSFRVRGVFEATPTGTFSTLGSDLNSTIFIPYTTGKDLTGDKAQIQQILVATNKGTNNDQAVKDVQAALAVNHKDGDNITVLKQSEVLSITSTVLNVITGFISGVAGISLLVGGIGIMNIMLVNVSERNREIGIRKAVGATNRQILGQFLTEGLVLTVFGGILAVLIAFGINMLLRITTDFKPVITWPIVFIATGVSIVIGVLFCITPALKAAKKDPIEALRNE